MIVSADVTSLVAAQTILQHGKVLGRWITPRRWCPFVTPAKRDVDVRARLIAAIPDESLRFIAEDVGNERLLKLAVETLTRYLLILRMGPAGTGRKGNARSLDPGQVADCAYYIAPTLFALALVHWLRSKDVAPTAGGLLSVVTVDDLAHLSASLRESVLKEVRRMYALHHRGCWEDLPRIGNDLGQITEVAGDAAPGLSERQRDSHLPLPDEYVSEMGQRSLWLMESLAPNLFAITQRILEIWEETDDGALASNIGYRRRLAAEKLLSHWEWRDDKGALIEKPPFDLKLALQGSEGEAAGSAWPPRNLASIFGLLSNLQLAHLFVVCLSTGGRRSETLDLRRDCVAYASDGRPYAKGRTFKLVQRHDGELRDWVLPDLAVVAIEQQSRLVKLVEAIGPLKPSTDGKLAVARSTLDHLWVQVSGGSASDRTKPLLHLERAMLSYARTLGMDLRPSNQWLRPHRFRKTVARMAALAITHAPKVLMDVFGHKSIEMTLYYILSDKALQAEIEQVGRELRVMRAKQAIESIVAAEDAGDNGLALGGYGGPAALMIDRAIKVQRERAHRRGELWGVDSVRELAEVLTLQGKAWEVVRHGVLCTKFPGSEAGPCNRSKGRPEPAHCQSDCSHRLEEAFLTDDVDAAIASCVAEYVTAIETDDDLLQAMWAGQIRAHVVRFEHLRVKWMCHPMVVRAGAHHGGAEPAKDPT
ncbi:MAG: hypothetical protein KXJ61_05610 [Hydrogenophaga sp.]|uniref:hypothetical protein n=1 Tax=Hydrogenophaga sp. TaxID=1904254 RepID=UPI001E0F4D98|nr:hypothetical protein [Hydrogenophaga sp.]MBW0169688.1 hypothetical protein [Hydrogenophaga sp.]MBW0183311.1 hypothetical protein [Hydrogenophaga sp.]